jgi:hypothetical protein
MFVYPRWQIDSGSVVAWLPVAGVVFIGGVAWWRGWPSCVGLGCFVLALLPVLGLFDIYYFRFSFVADHFDYIGSAALLALVVAVGTCWLHWQRGRMIAGTAVILVSSWLSWQRARV